MLSIGIIAFAKCLLLLAVIGEREREPKGSPSAKKKKKKKNQKPIDTGEKLCYNGISKGEGKPTKPRKERGKCLIEMLLKILCAVS